MAIKLSAPAVVILFSSSTRRFTRELVDSTVFFRHGVCEPIHLPQDTSPRGRNFLGVQEHHRIHRFDVPERSKVLGISTSLARTMPVSGLSQKS